jgi:hypothetical protein
MVYILRIFRDFQDFLQQSKTNNKMQSFLRENLQKSDPLLVRVLFKVFFLQKSDLYLRLSVDARVLSCNTCWNNFILNNVCLHSVIIWFQIAHMINWASVENGAYATVDGGNVVGARDAVDWHFHKWWFACRCGQPTYLFHPFADCCGAEYICRASVLCWWSHLHIHSKISKPLQMEWTGARYYQPARTIAKRSQLHFRTAWLRQSDCEQQTHPTLICIWYDFRRFVCHHQCPFQTTMTRFPVLQLTHHPQ